MTQPVGSGHQALWAALAVLRLAGFLTAGFLTAGVFTAGLGAAFTTFLAAVGAAVLPESFARSC